MSDAGQINRVMGPLEWGMLLTLSVLWGGSFFFTEVALVELRPFTVVLGRVGIAAVALIALVYLTGHRMPTTARLWGAFLIMGGINNLIPFSLIVWGQTEISSGLASILNATTPLFTVVLAHFLTSDEKMTTNRIVGVLAGFVGVVIMIGPDVLGGLGADVIAQFAVLAAALSYGFAGIFGRRFRELPAQVTAAGQVTATTVVMLPIAMVMERPWLLPAPSLSTIGAMVGIALLSTAAAYLLYFRILSTAGASNLLLVTFLIPVSAILLGVGVLGETLTPAQIVGMALISIGLAAIDGRAFTRFRGKRASRGAD